MTDYLNRIFIRHRHLQPAIFKARKIQRMRGLNDMKATMTS